MSPPRVMTAALAVTLSAGVLSPLDAQDRILLRYHPENRGQVMTTLWTDVDGRVAMGGIVEMVAAMAEEMARAFGGDSAAEVVRDSIDAAVAEGADDDSLTVLLELEQQISERLVGMEERGARVERRIITTRAVATSPDGLVEDEGVDAYPPASAELVLDDRMRILEFFPSRRDTMEGMLENMLRAPAGGMEITLPEDPVAPGTSWTTEMHFPFRMAGEFSGVIQGVDLRSEARLTLDSIAVRGADTLAYLRVGGEFEPFVKTETEAGASGTATVEGRFGGYLIWSTAWNAFVSGSSRILLTVDAEAEPGPEGAARSIEFGMRLDIRSRFRVGS